MKQLSLATSSKPHALWMAIFTIGLTSLCAGQEALAENEEHQPIWQEQAVDYARIMSRVKWTPVASGMPGRNGEFEPGKEYTGVPYSSVQSEGRYIGYDIFLKTFLAAVENPESVLYTESLEDKVKNAESYYGKVCSSYTSYALQCGIWFLSKMHGPEHRDGVIVSNPQSASNAHVGDVIYTPPSRERGGSHVELITEITRNGAGRISHVRVEESRPVTTKNTNYRAEAFNEHLKEKNRVLYHITDLDAWRGANRGERFLLPNYAEDSSSPEINRALLLDRGDWVPYFVGQPVKINVMDRDSLGVETLVIQRENQIVEEISLSGPVVIERVFEESGDYTVHCVMADGSLSTPCKFAVCDLELIAPDENPSLGASWNLSFSSANMKPIIIYLMSLENSYGRHIVHINEDDIQKGEVTIPTGVLEDSGRFKIWLIAENRYGRLKSEVRVTVDK